MRTGDLSSKVVQVFWEKFAMKISPTTASESRGALLLIGMVAGFVLFFHFSLIFVYAGSVANQWYC